VFAAEILDFWLVGPAKNSERFAVFRSVLAVFGPTIQHR
jgi:hypothetical protein